MSCDTLTILVRSPKCKHCHVNQQQALTSTMLLCRHHYQNNVYILLLEEGFLVVMIRNATLISKKKSKEKQEQETIGYKIRAGVKCVLFWRLTPKTLSMFIFMWCAGIKGTVFKRRQKCSPSQTDDSDLQNATENLSFLIFVGNLKFLFYLSTNGKDFFLPFGSEVFFLVLIWLFRLMPKSKISAFKL